MYIHKICTCTGMFKNFKILEILTKNNRDVRGIAMDGIELMCKPSQFADDESLISDSSPESKDGTLRVLDYFADLYIYGQKITVKKLK